MAAYSIILILLVIVILFGIFYFFRYRARKKALKKKYGRVPSHMELYFEEYFDEMIESWDLVKKDEVDDWVTDMSERVIKVSDDIDDLKATKQDIDQELSAVEKRIESLKKKESRR